MQRIHRAKRFTGQCRDGFIHHAIHQRETIAGITQQRFSRQAHAVQRDFRPAQAIRGRIAAPRDTLRIGGHQENTNAGFVAPGATGARGHDDVVRHITMQHHALAAFQHPARAILLRRGRDIMQIMARLRFGIAKGKFQLARSNFRHHRGTLGRRGTMADKATTHHHRRKPGFQRDRAAHGFRHQHHFHRPGAKAAIFFRERQAEQAEIGISFPHFLRPAGG